MSLSGILLEAGTAGAARQMEGVGGKAEGAGPGAQYVLSHKGSLPGATDASTAEAELR